MVNIRLVPGDRVQTAIEHVTRAIGDPRVKIRACDEPCEPSDVSDTASPGWDLLERTIRQTFPDVVVAPFLVVAQTDARRYQVVSGTVLRFLPTRMEADRGDLDRLHGIDERVGTDNYLEIVRFYAQLIRNSG
jgi:carboxypeptidase PM20D1